MQEPIESAEVESWPMPSRDVRREIEARAVAWPEPERLDEPALQPAVA